MYNVVHTLGLGAVVVGLAEQLFVLHQVELVARVQLAGAEHAGEALYVVDVLLGTPHHRAGRDALTATRALGPILSIHIKYDLSSNRTVCPNFPGHLKGTVQRDFGPPFFS